MQTLPPAQLDGANVICFARLEARHHQRDEPSENSETGLFITNYVDGEPMKPPAALAVCQYDQKEGRQTYLFFCSYDWKVVQDVDFGSVEEAIQQACVQYDNLRPEDWQKVRNDE